MNIQKGESEGALTLSLSGSLDSTGALALEKVLKRSVREVKSLTLDFAQIAFVSSAGLRVLLAAQKVMNRQGRMVIKNANKSVMDILEITGFSEILHFND